MMSPPKKFTKQIAFNVIPHIDVFLDDGSTKEEWKMVAETKKIVDPSIKLTATCVRVPVFVGHGEAVNIETEEFLDEDEARDILRESPGIMVVDKREDGGYVTPVECVGRFRDLHQPDPAGFDDRQRAELLVRVRQPAQGRGAERGADRRDAGQPGPEEGLIVQVRNFVVFRRVAFGRRRFSCASARVGHRPPAIPVLCSNSGAVVACRDRIGPIAAMIRC